MNRYAIGDNIRRYVKMKDMTLRVLADEIGVGWDTMSKWINGHRQITAYGLYKCSQVLGVPMEWLMEGVDNE